jgi:hypothetical protein
MYYTMLLSIKMIKEKFLSFAAARGGPQIISNYSLSLIEASRDPLVTISIQGKIL